MVLHDADPLAGIRNVSRISYVVFGGRLVNKRAIDRIFASRRRTRSWSGPGRAGSQRVLTRRV